MVAALTLQEEEYYARPPEPGDVGWMELDFEF